MITITRLRIFRLRHGISLNELQRHSGSSHQYISRLELCKRGRTLKNERMMADAIRSIINSRRAALECLEQEFEECNGNLLVPLEVEKDEL